VGKSISIHRAAGNFLNSFFTAAPCPLPARSAGAPIPICLRFLHSIGAQPAALVVMVWILVLRAGDGLGQGYDLTDLGVLAGPDSFAQGINNQGHVVGYRDTPKGARAFLYRGGTLMDLGWGGAGSANSYAWSINPSGQVAGFSETPQGVRAFLYRNGTLTRLGAWSGWGSYAFGINRSGQVVGCLSTPGGLRAFLYDAGDLLQIGTLGGTNSIAFSVNSSSQVAGSSLTTNSVVHAFVWEKGWMADLNQLQESGWELTGASGINDLGNIAGWGTMDHQVHAYLFYSGGAVTDLGTLPGGTNSFALALNNSNQVVGTSSAGNGNHAVVWQAGALRDLNALIAVPGWVLREATGINDPGQIIGWGTIQGEVHAWLLTPMAYSSELARSLIMPGSSLPVPSPAPMLAGSLSIVLTAPVSGASFSAPTNLLLAAAVTASGGAVTQVVFFAGRKILGVKTTSPYSLNWSNAAPGVHTLSAVAMDTVAQRATSGVVTVSIATNCLPLADAYVRDGSSVKVNFGTAKVMECLTTMTNGNNRDIYFKFDLGGLGNVGSAQLKVFAGLSAAGAVSNTAYSVADTVWTETGLTWSNKPVRVSALTTNRVSGTNWVWYDVGSYVQSQLAAGTGVVSLALHDSENAGALLSVNSRENAANRPVLVVVPALSVTLASPADRSVVRPGADVILDARVSSVGDTPVQVRFYDGTNSLGWVDAPPYTLLWSKVACGVHALTARATDNFSLPATSRLVTVSAADILITSPANNGVVTAPANLSLRASVTDALPVVQVQFFQGTNSLGRLTAPPYNLVWTNVVDGVYALTVRASDAGGWVFNSVAVNVIVDTNSAVSDRDGDKMSDLLESLAGRNPLVKGAVADANQSIALQTYTPWY